MLRVVLIRPGSTEFDRQGRIQGTLEIPLSPEGGHEVEKLIDQLKNYGIEQLYCSDSQPALQTAETLAGAICVKLKKMDNMHNLDHGLWQGSLIDDVRRKQPKVYRQWQAQPQSICPPEGETLDEARTRIKSGIKRILKKHKQGTIGLVVPEPLATLVRCHLSNAAPGDLWTAAEGHGQWEVIDVGPNLPAPAH